jgi:hypothetical protein
MKQKNLLLNLFAPLVVVVLAVVFWVPAFAEEEVSTAYYTLTYQDQEDLFLGKAGVFMVYPAEDLEFFDRWLDFGIYDYYGNPYLGLYGFNYVYFNLKYQTRRLWDEGELSIYRWDENKRDWVNCPSYLVEMKNLPHGRVTCIMTTFGTYGIATEK